MSHKMGYENSPEDNLKTWAMLQRIITVSCVAIPIVLMVLYFAFMY